MTRTEIVEQIKFLEKQRDKASDPDDKRRFQMQINYYEDELRKIDRNCDERSTAQNVVGTVTRIISGAASMVVGEVDACVTGRTDEDQVKRRRGKFVDAAESKAVKTVGFIENLIKNRK